MCVDLHGNRFGEHVREGASACPAGRHRRTRGRRAARAWWTGRRQGSRFGWRGRVRPGAARGRVRPVRPQGHPDTQALSTHVRGAVAYGAADQVVHRCPSLP